MQHSKICNHNNRERQSLRTTLEQPLSPKNYQHHAGVAIHEYYMKLISPDKVHKYLYCILFAKLNVGFFVTSSKI